VAAFDVPNFSPTPAVNSLQYTTVASGGDLVLRLGGQVAAEKKI